MPRGASENVVLFYFFSRSFVRFWLAPCRCVYDDYINETYTALATGHHRRHIIYRKCVQFSTEKFYYT